LELGLLLRACKRAKFKKEEKGFKIIKELKENNGPV
jgi:hypothetical protein